MNQILSSTSTPGSKAHRTLEDPHKTSAGFLRYGHWNGIKIDSVKDPFMNPLCVIKYFYHLGGGSYTSLIKHLSKYMESHQKLL